MRVGKKGAPGRRGPQARDSEKSIGGDVLAVTGAPGKRTASSLGAGAALLASRPAFSSGTCRVRSKRLGVQGVWLLAVVKKACHVQASLEGRVRAHIDPMQTFSQVLTLPAI